MTQEIADQGEVATETSSAVQAAYDRIANPGKVQEEVKEAVIESTAETPPDSVLTPDDIKELRAQVARIPELEKRLRDDGGRYGALKQSLEQVQQRIADQKEATGSAANVDEILADIKEKFGEDELYTGLKSAFSKLAANNRGIDPGEVEKIVSSKISEAKQAQFKEAVDQLTEAHPTWMQDRETPEFNEWRDSLPAKVRDRLSKSEDPEYVSDKLHEFVEWKAKKVATPEPKEEVKPAVKAAPSKRLIGAVLPTNGTKPKVTGEDRQAQIRAAYERVAGNRR